MAGRPKKNEVAKSQPIKVDKPQKINSMLNDFNNDDDDIVEALELSKQVKQTDEVLVMNNTSGILVMANKTNNRQWILDRYGKKCRMTVGDILDIMGEQGIIFTEGWALILDEDVIKYLGLTDSYMKLISPKKMENFFNLPDNEMEEALIGLPTTLKIDMARIIKQKITQGDKSLDSRSKINLLEKHLKLNI